MAYWRDRAPFLFKLGDVGNGRPLGKPHYEDPVAGRRSRSAIGQLYDKMQEFVAKGLEELKGEVTAIEPDRDLLPKGDRRHEDAVGSRFRHINTQIAREKEREGVLQRSAGRVVGWRQDDDGGAASAISALVAEETERFDQLSTAEQKHEAALYYEVMIADYNRRIKQYNKEKKAGSDSALSAPPQLSAWVPEMCQKVWNALKCEAKGGTSLPIAPGREEWVRKSVPQPSVADLPS